MDQETIDECNKFFEAHPEYGWLLWGGEGTSFTLYLNESSDPIYPSQCKEDVYYDVLKLDDIAEDHSEGPFVLRNPALPSGATDVELDSTILPAANRYGNCPKCASPIEPGQRCTSNTHAINYKKMLEEEEAKGE